MELVACKQYIGGLRSSLVAYGQVGGLRTRLVVYGQLVSDEREAEVVRLFTHPCHLLYPASCGISRLVKHK